MAQRSDEPDCPHCGKELKGWVSPEDLRFEFWEGFLTIALVIGIVANVIAFVTGAATTNWRDCEWPTTKGSLLVPAVYVGCATGKWMWKPWKDPN